MKNASFEREKDKAEWLEANNIQRNTWDALFDWASSWTLEEYKSKRMKKPELTFDDALKMNATEKQYSRLLFLDLVHKVWIFIFILTISSHL